MVAEYSAPNLSQAAIKRKRIPWLGSDGIWRVPLTRGQTALVDTLGASLVASRLWQAQPRSNKDGTFYARSGRAGLMHRLICPCPVGFEVDHINGNGLDNRAENLRVVTRHQQMRNRKTWGKSGYRGVQCREGGWAVYIGKPIQYVGFYATAREAAHAYDQRARELYGSFAALNFPDSDERGAR